MTFDKRLPAAIALAAVLLPAAGLAEPTPDDASVLDDAHEGAAALVRGSLKACEVPLLPLALIPGADTVIEWGCLIPAVLTLNHYGVRDARRHSYYLQPALALVAGKLVQDALRTPYLIGLVAGVVVYAGAATGVALLGFPWLWPVGAAGLLALIGGSYLIFDDLKEDLFLWLVPSLFLWTSPPIQPGEVSTAESVELFSQPLPGWVRPWELLVVASGVRADSALMDLVPVVGPFDKAERRATRVKTAMRWVGREQLGAQPADPESMDRAIESWAWVEALTVATSQTLLITAGGLCLTGLAFGTHAAYQVDQKQDATASTAIAIGVGSAGIIAGLGGVGIALIRKVPSAGLALSAAWHFGLLGSAEDSAVEGE